VSGPPPSAAATDAAIVAMTAARRGAADRTDCPSEVARALAGAGGEWRELMPAVREWARSPASQGQLKVAQRGRAVDGGVRGPVRIAPG
jgi:Protein of unknown function (DUF3253)